MSGRVGAKSLASWKMENAMRCSWRGGAGLLRKRRLTWFVYTGIPLSYGWLNEHFEAVPRDFLILKHGVDSVSSASRCSIAQAASTATTSTTTHLLRPQPPAAQLSRPCSSQLY